MSPDAFVENAKTLVDLGWHPIPLTGEGGKTCRVRGVQGRAGVDVTDEETFREWADSFVDEGLNLGVRMPVGVIGIDVDAYDGKGGAETLAAKECDWGPLPATWSVTARSDGSRKMFFRVPEGWESKGIVGPGVEVIQRHHRYSVAPPSVHDVGLVKVFAPDRHDCGQLPPPAELPELPRAWLLGLGKDAPTVHAKASAEDAARLADEFRDGPLGDGVTDALNLVLIAIADGGGRHDSLNKALPNLVRLGAAGRSGVATALRTAESEFAEAIGDRLHEGRALDEFRASLDGALGLVAGQRAGLDFYTGDTFDADGKLRPDSSLARSLRGVVSDAILGFVDDSSLSSWLPVDVAAALSSGPPPFPSVGEREDGLCLFYAGKVHSVHGESESGKSWLVQCAAVQQLQGDGAVLFVDFEDSVESVVGRLLSLGVPRHVLTDPTRFVYVRPEEALRTEAAEAAFGELVARPFSLAVVDGVTDAMGVFGYSAKDNDDIAAWQRELPRRIARSSGAAVVCIDHVTKDADTRGRFAIGGQHKIAGLDGAAYVVEVERPFAVGLAGSAVVRVGKDRPGHVRSAGVSWRKSDRTQRIAEFHLDSTDPEASTFAVRVPKDDPAAGRGTSPGEEGAEPTGQGSFRPTWFMEQISRYLETAENAADRTQNKTITAMCERRKTAGKSQKRQHWRTALDLLVSEGYVLQETGQDRRGSMVHNVAKAYRQTADPDADAYTGGRKAGDLKCEVVGMTAPTDGETDG